MRVNLGDSSLGSLYASVYVKPVGEVRKSWSLRKVENYPYGNHNAYSNEAQRA
jgi:hypothetical protein